MFWTQLCISSVYTIQVYATKKTWSVRFSLGPNENVKKKTLEMTLWEPSLVEMFYKCVKNCLIKNVVHNADAKN